MFTHGGLHLAGLGDIVDGIDTSSFDTSTLAPVDSSLFNFNASNPLGVSNSSLVEGNTISSVNSLYNYIAGQADSAYNYSPSILNSTVSAPTSVSSSTPNWQQTINQLIPGLTSTTEKILSTQYSVPQTSAGQFFSTNSKTGVTTTYTLPSSAGSSLSISNPFGASLTSSGSLLPILAIGALALFLFNKK